MTFYSAIKAFHIMAAFAAYGLPFAYPFLLPYLHRHHPEALPGVHDIQHRLNKVLTGPGTVLLFLFGTYMATKNHLWGETWVDIPIAILAVIVVAGGLIVRWTGELATLSTTDVSSATDTITFSSAYSTTYRRYMLTETMLGLLVLIAIFFMTAKPFS
ncbi:hypothetical protein [Conexibacter woesei]|uniref:hypothetical protein n=1 Tax=Conexibacter woesei TaxID=191495 RepID=UPI000428D51C|nr:hypothetical protein [Conexibacter woesei]